jgi:hypothetical protein
MEGGALNTTKLVLLLTKIIVIHIRFLNAKGEKVFIKMILE